MCTDSSLWWFANVLYNEYLFQFDWIIFHLCRERLSSDQVGVFLDPGWDSTGKGCILSRSPGIYTRVSHYQTWIKSIIATNQPGFMTFISIGVDSDNNVTCDKVLHISTPPETAQISQISLSALRLFYSPDREYVWLWNRCTTASHRNLVSVIT